jgi:predicted nucleotidyltransferase
MNDIINTFPEAFRADIKKASEILKKHGCIEIYIFGSAANGKFNDKSDIDIAVRGLKDEYYFKVLAELGNELVYDVDLIDLDDDTNRFAQFILEKGGLIKVA